jgi:ABC-type Mn2+/Zn2+ transport system ATPase subunit
MSDGAVVRATGLALGYGSTVVLRDVELAVGTGAYWFLVGPNGSGKTTFVRALFGLVDVLAGRLWVDPEGGGQARIGFVPQRCVLNPSLPTTVGELVELGLVGLRLDARGRAERVDAALGQVGLAGEARRDHRTLSGGQGQRVLLARALVRRPAVLVLDEPEAGLDLAAEERLLELLDRVNREDGVTLLHVSHDLASVRRHASHVALFHHGSVESGPAAGVLTAANLTRAYGIAVGRPEAAP